VEFGVSNVDRKPNRRLERTRHERASLLSRVGEPLGAKAPDRTEMKAINLKPLSLAHLLVLALTCIAAFAQDRAENKGKYSVAGLDDDREVEQFFLAFKKGIADDDKEMVGSMIAFPIKVTLTNGYMVTLRNKAGFIRAYDRVFDKRFKKIILQTQAEDLWAKFSGVAMPHGEIWINGVLKDKRNIENYQIKITTINNIGYRGKHGNGGER